MPPHHVHRLAMSGLLLATLGACTVPDFDMRGQIDTTNAVRTASQPRPEPDSRGVISYPTYQVAVARPGDTVTTIAARIGVDPNQLSTFNGIDPQTPLRANEIIALPSRVPTGPAANNANGDISITTLAGDAISRADSGAPAGTVASPNAETPVRHRVERGETAFTIARLYGVSVRALADWNGLGPDFAVREGQYLLIPVTEEVQEVTTSRPGGTSAAPTPPSASKPLPTTTVTAAKLPANDLSAARTSTSRFEMPVSGKIIRGYEKRVNDGIDIAASPGTAVKAAEAGSVAAITRDTEGVPILVLRHADNLLTVYANIADLKVAKGDKVSRGQTIASVRGGNPSFLHFEVRDGFESADPTPFLN